MCFFFLHLIEAYPTNLLVHPPKSLAAIEHSSKMPTPLEDFDDENESLPGHKHHHVHR